MNLLKLSWKNLISKPLDMSLSILLFSLGIGLISLLFLLQKQLQDNFEKNLAGVDLVIGAKGSPLQLILCSMYHIDSPTGNISLKEARPFLNPNHPLIEKAVPLSMGDSYKGYRIVGTEPGFLELYQASIGQGRVWSQNFEVTIGAGIAEALNLKIGDHFKSSHGLMDDEELSQDHDHEFEVVGILAPSGTVVDQLILTTTQSFWLVHEHESEAETTAEPATEEHEHDEEHLDHEHEGEDSHEKDHDHEHGEEHSDHHHDGEQAHDHDHHAELTPKSLLEEPDDKAITSLLLRFKGHNYQALNMQRGINENTDMQAATPAIEINRLFNLMGTGEQALRILAIVIIFVSGLSIFISLYSSLKERKYELALMRVMGASRGHLFSLIILEGVLLALLGFAIGMVLSHGGMSLLAAKMEAAYRYSFQAWVFLQEEVWLLIGAVVIGFVAAILPAIQASSTDIADTLTGE
ncbi:MAG TPA: ABC transporter permease [Saprospiraceae bacterium]|nr:ABC transporter permease [Saprospiraceae bacterium]HMQ85480.1 ABC transporter permease [Saprospiraceae bacterium]